MMEYFLYAFPFFLQIASNLELERNYTMLLDYNAASDLIYMGLAESGSAESASVWQIRRLDYDASKNLLNKKWANGTTLLDKVWNDRTTYSYS